MISDFGIARAISAASGDQLTQTGLAIGTPAYMSPEQVEGSGLDIDTRVLTAVEIRQMAEPYIRRRAMRHMEKGRVVIFAAGTGNPYFSTDTAAALRAMEMQADMLCKATKVEGVYDKDPVKFADAAMSRRVSYDHFIRERMGVMDSTAVALCRENGLPIRVFKMARGNIRRVCLGENVGTTVSDAA